ncbi:MAG: rhodanese-like domain-containing protein [Balneolaceae bacterium]|nr:rhodanese-like domain-containing protein [Balneolaceae bacterium]
MKKATLPTFAFSLLLLATACEAEKKAPQTEPTPALAPVTSSYTDITQDEFKNMESNLPEDVVILDVRTDPEVAEGMIDGAIQIDYRSENFADEVAKLDTSKTYIVYCRSGGRSSAASKLMTEELGFKNVNNLLGGYSEYSSEDFEN